MVVTDYDVMKLEMQGFLFLFSESNKKSSAGLSKQMRRCLRNNFFFLFGLIKRMTPYFYSKIDICTFDIVTRFTLKCCYKYNKDWYNQHTCISMKSKFGAVKCMKKRETPGFFFLLFLMLDIMYSSQQFFSQIGMGYHLPGLNLYGI